MSRKLTETELLAFRRLNRKLEVADMETPALRRARDNFVAQLTERFTVPKYAVRITVPALDESFVWTFSTDNELEKFKADAADGDLGEIEYHVTNVIEVAA